MQIKSFGQEATTDVNINAYSCNQKLGTYLLIIIASVSPPLNTMDAGATLAP